MSFCHYNMKWKEEHLNFIPNFYHWLIFDCVEPHWVHLNFIELIICMFTGGK